jgi:hypothetical protein
LPSGFALAVRAILFIGYYLIIDFIDWFELIESKELSYCKIDQVSMAFKIMSYFSIHNFFILFISSKIVFSIEP